MAFMDTWNQFHPIEARLFGGSGPQPNMAGPRWVQTAPGRYEMEGGVPQSMQADGNYRPGGNLMPQQTGGGLPPQQPMGTDAPTMTGGPMQQFANAPGMMTGGGAQQFGGFHGMTGGPGQMQAGGFPGMTGGPGQRMAGGGQSSYRLMPQAPAEPQRQPNPFGRFLPR